MLPLFVLILSLAVFRTLGLVGLPLFATWHASARWALAVMLFFTASAHFTSMKEDLVRMTPRWVPRPRTMVYFTGLCEIAGAVGLLVPTLTRIAGILLVLLFVALLPANVHASKARVTLRGKPATRLLLRTPIQILFIAWVWWSTQ